MGKVSIFNDAIPEASMFQDCVLITFEHVFRPIVISTNVRSKSSVWDKSELRLIGARYANGLIGMCRRDFAW